MTFHHLSPPVAGYLIPEEEHARLVRLERRLHLLAVLAGPGVSDGDDPRLTLSREALSELFADLASECRTAAGAAAWSGASLKP